MGPLIGITPLYLLGDKLNPVTGKRQGENRNIVDGICIDFVAKAGARWHPEEMTGSGPQLELFWKFVGACRQ